MSHQQIAKLFVRGSLCNDKLKNLSPADKEEIERVVELVMIDPNLQQCQREFCSALSRTIKNEYRDIEAGRQDYRVAIMRAAVAAHFEENGKEINSDPQQRKKWYQTWGFNYLKQVLRENKIPARRVVQESEKTLEELATNQITAFLSDFKKQFSTIDIKNGFRILINTFILPRAVVQNILSLKEMYFKEGISINISDSDITIIRTGDISFRTVTETLAVPLREFSMDTDEDEDNKNYQPQSTRRETVEQTETIEKLKERLPEQAQPVLRIYMEEERPQDYIEQYGIGRPKIAHISQYLSISPREVKRLLWIIQIHLSVLRLGY
jgi:hypothetical protein